MPAASGAALALLAALAAPVRAAFSSWSPEGMDSVLECKRKDSDECRARAGATGRRSLAGAAGAERRGLPEPPLAGATRFLDASRSGAARAACARMLSCEACLGASSGCYGWLGSACCDEGSCELAAEGGQAYYTSCEEWNKTRARLERCAGIPGARPCQCLEAGCVAQRVGAGATACFGEHKQGAGLAISAEECEAFEGGARLGTSGGFCTGSPEQTCKMACDPVGCPDGQCAMRQGDCCNVTCQPQQPNESASPGTSAGDGFCPGSPAQACKKVCAPVACPDGQCAMRLGDCCDLTCQPQRFNASTSLGAPGAPVPLCPGAPEPNQSCECPPPACHPGRCARRGGACCEWTCEAAGEAAPATVALAVVCPGSVGQLCKMECPAPVCPTGQCANRSGSCCDWTCQDVPLESSEQELSRPWAGGDTCDGAAATCEECLGSGCHGWMAGGGCCAAKADCLLVAAGDRHFYTSCEAAANATRRAETCPGIRDVCECGRKGCFPQEVGNGEFACFGDYQGVAGRMIRPEECEGFSGGGKIPGPRPADQITDTPIQ